MIYEGAGRARGAAAVLAAIASAEAIVIGPSNPILSIGPILAVAQIRAAIDASPAPVVAVSPIVGGEVLKGPTAACMAWAGVSADAAGIAAHYGELIDAMITDEGEVEGVPTLTRDTRMDSADSRRELASATLALARSLSA